MYLINTRPKRGMQVAVCILMVVGFSRIAFAAAGHARPAVRATVGRRLAAAMVWRGWWQIGRIPITRSPLPVTVVRLPPKSGPPGVTVRFNHYRFWVPDSSSVSCQVSLNIILRKDAPAVLSYSLHGRKISKGLWFHITKLSKLAPTVRPGVALALQLYGSGPDRGHYVTVRLPGLSPSVPPPTGALLKKGGAARRGTRGPVGFQLPPGVFSGKQEVWLNYSSKVAVVPSGASDISLHVRKWAEGRINVVGVRFPQCPGAKLGWRLTSGGRLGSQPPESFSQELLEEDLYFSHSYPISNYRNGEIRMMTRALIRSGYTPAAAKAMVISALRSLTQESGYQLEVSSFGVCAKKLVRINNPMAALRMAWLAETSVANERTDRVELPDGDTVLCAGLRPEGDGRHWGITFRLHAYDRKKQLRRPTGWVHFSNWSHARKSDLKAILIYARIIDSVHRSPR